MFLHLFCQECANTRLRADQTRTDSRLSNLGLPLLTVLYPQKCFCTFQQYKNIFEVSLITAVYAYVCLYPNLCVHGYHSII